MTCIFRAKKQASAYQRVADLMNADADERDAAGSANDRATASPGAAVTTSRIDVTADPF